MGTVIYDGSISLDGYIAGPNDGVENALGDGGEALFAWMTDGPPANRMKDFFQPPDASLPIIEEWFATTGAIISGRRTYEIAHGWGGHHPIGVPFFVLTHDAPAEIAGGADADGTFVTDGIARALELAQAVAGTGTVSLCAADVAQQFLRAGLLQEIQLHVAPVILGGGVRLFADVDPASFRLVQTRVIVSDNVTHLRYRVEYP